MTDAPSALFADLSSNNAPLTAAKYAKAGHRLVALKATEGTSYAWTDGLSAARAAHAADLTVIWYHFARPGSGVAQAETFLAHIAAEFKPGDALCIDCEVDGVNGKLVTAWLNRVHKAHPNADLWIYGGAYFLRDHNIRPVHGAKLWLAAYGNTVPFIPPGWDHYDAWQFTDSASVKGIGCRVDLSRLYAAPKPAPKPKPARKPTAHAKHPNAGVRFILGWLPPRLERFAARPGHPDADTASAIARLVKAANDAAR